MKAKQTTKADGHPASNALRRVLAETGVDFRLAMNDDAPEFLTVHFPDSGTTLMIAYHHALAPLQVKYAVQGLRHGSGPDVPLGICVRRLSASLLDACKEQGIAAFDLGGNAYLKIPGVFIERMRPTPAETAQPVAGTVFTSKATRVVRALLTRYPWDKPRAELAKETGLSPGYISILVKRLIERGYATDRLGMVYLDEPDRLLDDWAAHYRFDRHQKHAFAITAKSYDEGIEKLRDALNEAGTPYAFTGWTGAHLRAPYAAPANYMAYVRETPRAVKGLFPVGNGGNVLLYVPHDEGVFQYTTTMAAGSVVSDAQLYLDLYRMPGRAKEQADALRNSRLKFAKKVS